MGSGVSYLVSNWEQIIFQKLQTGHLVYLGAHQEINVSTLKRFCQLSKTLPPAPVFNEHNHD